MAVKFPSNSDDQPWYVCGKMLLALAFLVAGCAQQTTPQGFRDPDEAQNRSVHALNLAIDRAIVSPGAEGYDAVLPAPVEQSIANLANTLDVPGDIANHLLQLRLGKAAENTLRLGVNLTVGVGGLFDPASALGLPRNKTDFGETLHVWGAEEGAYLVLPLFGPSTTRDTVGGVVDLAINPLRLILPSPESGYATLAKLGSRLGDRSRYSDTLDSILYESADGYAQQRLLYLQNRRFELGQTSGADSDFYDPYEDPYGE